MPVSWETADPKTPLDSVRDTLVKRARKRVAWPLDNMGTWVVEGNSSLGDQYEDYYVESREGNYHCTCQDHVGGEHRRLCSHIVRVWLTLFGDMEWSDEAKETTQWSDEEEGQADDGPITPSSSHDSKSAPPPDSERGLSEYDAMPDPLPDWVEGIRPWQVVAVDEIVRLFEAGKQVVMLDGPTGTGKTLIGELVRRKLKARAVYTCTTKTLQEQVAADFPYADVIKGRANYATADSPDAFPDLACDLCDEKLMRFPGCHKCLEAFPDMEEGDEMRHCDLCHPWYDSGYQQARQAAASSWLSVANTAYLLREMQGHKSIFSGRALHIIDEADLLETEIMRSVEIVISPRTLKTLGIGKPKLITKPESWLDWCLEEAIPAYTALLNRMKGGRLASPKQKRAKARVADARDQLVWMCKQDDPSHQDNPVRLMENYVLDGYARGYVIFKPIRIGAYTREMLWQHGPRFLLMSATIISAGQMAQDLGLGESEWGQVKIPSAFDPKRRPLFIEPVAKMTAKTYDEEMPKMSARIQEIADENLDQRILVHTVSYKLAGDLFDGLGGRQKRTYRSAQERDEVLANWLQTDNGVLFAPSFDRGIDLVGDQCRRIIIAKIPYPYLGDKQISKRLYASGGQGWYAMQTARTMVQMSGRAMRSIEDYCETWILDSQFLEVWRKNKNMIPRWWADAIVWGGSKERR